MRKTHHFLLITSLLLSGWMFSALPLAQASQLYSVTLDTSSLSTLTGPFYVDFQLTDGSGTNDRNNTVELSNFQFGVGGSAVDGTTTLVGDAQGSLTTSVEITDSFFLNEFIQQFIPGSILSFDLHLIPNLDSGLTQDQFSFAILDDQQFELPTDSPDDAFLTINFTSPLGVQPFSSELGSVPFFTAPTIKAIPVPGTLALLLVGLGRLLRFGKRGNGRPV